MLRVLVCFAALAALAACDTMKQDLQAFGDSLTPVSPSQAARWMVDMNDADNRRRGLVLISNAPFGGAEVYVAIYRDDVLYETNPLVKAAAITALGRHGRPSDVPAIAATLSDASVQVRWAAARALQRLHNDEAVPALLVAMLAEEQDEDVRMAAAIALGQYPQDRVFQGLVAALDDRRLSVNAAARESLRTVTGQDFGLDPKAWLKWYDEVDDPFAGKKEYLFPTYQRDKTFMEMLAFWSSREWEKPAPPAGLDSQERRI